jgi:hypothetical protein
VKKIVLGLTAVLAMASLVAVPMTADARDHGAGIALGVLGGAAVGAAIASTANPYYGGYSYPSYATASGYYYPQSTYYAPQSYYYPQSNYYAPQGYYYPQSNYYGPSHSDGN